MMIKREIKRNVRKYGVLFEPLLVLVLLIFFVGPLLIVVNLSPQPSTPPLFEDDVLGVTDEKIPTIKLVGGTHKYINDERIAKDNSLVYEYFFTLLARDKGIYNKPVLQISNPTDDQITIQMNMTRNEPSKTQISFALETSVQTIKRSNGSKNIIEFSLEPQQVVIIDLEAISAVKTNFNESYLVNINILGWDDPLVIPADEMNDYPQIDLEVPEESVEPGLNENSDGELGTPSDQLDDSSDQSDTDQYGQDVPTSTEEELPLPSLDEELPVENE